MDYEKCIVEEEEGEEGGGWAIIIKIHSTFEIMTVVCWDSTLMVSLTLLSRCTQTTRLLST